MRPSLGALLRFELKLQLRHPISWAFVVVVLVWRIGATWQRMPDWSVEIPDTALAGLVVGAGVMLAANLATLRDGNSAAVELCQPLPTRPHSRTLVTLIACLIAGTLLGLLVMGAQVASMLVGSVPVGQLNPRDLCSGVLVAALMAATGVALGRWTPGLIAGPVAILIFFWTSFQFSTSWLLPVVPRMDAVPDPPRPPIWHPLYATAVIVLVAGIALLRHGVRPLRGGVVAIGVVAALFAGTMSITSPEADTLERLSRQPGSLIPVTRGADHCAALNGVNYCAFPAFAAWIPLWQQAVEPVAAAVPAEARAVLPAVRQRRPHGTLDGRIQAENVLTNTTWGRNGGETESRRWLAAQVAAAATGLPRTGQHGSSRVCDARGQARTVVALWLIGQVEKPVLPHSTRVFVRQQGSAEEVARDVATSDIGAVDYGQVELSYANRLLAAGDARDRVRTHWAKIVDPATGVDDALALLGLKKEFPVEQPQGAPCE
jgi:hypothetical protein